MKIMFICTGNICRSAMAHAMLEKKARENKKNIEVYSCGISAEDGDFPTEEAIEVMKTYDIDLSNHRATNIKNSKIEEMDIILCATTLHKNKVISLYPKLKDKVFTMKEFADYSKNDIDISDPWGYSISIYRKCAEQINNCIQKYIEKI